MIDLLKVVDAAHGGRLHAELGRIAQGLGIEIPPVDPVPHPPGGALEDNNDQGNALAGLLELLGALCRQPRIRTASEVGPRGVRV